MEAELDEICSTLMNRATTENSNEADDDSETSGSVTDGRTDDSETSEDDEDTDRGLASEKNSPSVSKSTKRNVSESEETSTDGSDDEDTSDSVTDDEDNFTILTTSNDEADNPGIKSKRAVTDRGGGDADQPHYDTDVITIADDGTSCATMKVKIVTKKRQHDPQAYQKWIQAKNDEIRRNREMEKLRAQQLDAQKRHEEEQRKEMNKAKFTQWMQRKKQKECSGTKPAPSMESTSSSTQQFIQNDADARFKTWLQRVKKRDEEKRAKEILQKQREMEERDHKKKVSQAICNEWLKAARNKPRPVPMNQGLHTLKGTVSKIFINPEPWKTNCD